MSNFSITFEVINDDRARAFVNGVSIGLVRKRDGRVIFRCGRNPGSNTVSSIYDHSQTRDAGDFDRYDNVPMAEIIRDYRLQPSLYSIVLRNALRNYGGVLFQTPAERAQDEAEFFNLPTDEPEEVAA